MEAKAAEAKATKVKESSEVTKVEKRNSVLHLGREVFLEPNFLHHVPITKDLMFI